MQSRRSVIDVVGSSGRRFSGDAVLPEQVSPSPGRRDGVGSRSTGKPGGGAARLALMLGMALLPAVGRSQTVEWVRSAGGTSIDQALGIAIDPAGNSYVTGNFCETSMFGPFTLTSAGINDIFVAKYDTSGNVLWARSDGGKSGEDGHAIAVDGSGNSYVTGNREGTSIFGPFTLTGGGFFLAKYDSSGNVLWVRSAEPTAENIGRGIAVDAVGTSYVTGLFHGTAIFGAFMLESSDLSADIFVVKCDAGGTVLWARSAGGTLSDQGVGIAIDALGSETVDTGRGMRRDERIVARRFCRFINVAVTATSVEVGVSQQWPSAKSSRPTNCDTLSNEE